MVNLYFYFNQNVSYGMSGLCKGIRSDIELRNETWPNIFNDTF